MQKSSLKYLRKALITNGEDLLTCHEVEELLPEYLEAEMEGQANQNQWASVILHLETCPYCAEEYAKLVELSAFAYGEQGVKPLRYPFPDLSFLKESKPKPSTFTSKFWRLDDLGRLIIQFSAELVQQLQMLSAQPAYAQRNLSKPSGVLLHLSSDEIDADLEVTVAIEEQKDNPDRATLFVDVNIPSREGWPHLADTEVILKRDEQALQSQTTDAFGKIIFKGISFNDLSSLVLEIAPRI